MNGNTSGAGGGGIANIGPMTIENSTISGNTDTFRAGGRIFNFSFGTLNVKSSTVSGNTGGGIAIAGPVTLKNTIVGKNADGDCQGVPPPPTSLGHNLDSDGSCHLTGPGDISGVDPRLGPLADNGGPTETHALLPGSPAIDAGSPDCPPPPTDQRGVARPQGPACDIGAFELVTAPAPVRCQWSVDGTLVGTREAAPPGARDFHVTWMGLRSHGVLVWTKNGTVNSGAIKSPAGANDFRVVWGRRAIRFTKAFWTKDGVDLQPIPIAPGSNDLFLKLTRRGVFEKAVWTDANGNPIQPITPAPRANDVHLELKSALAPAGSSSR